MEASLRERVVVVTGGTQGVGRGIAERFLDAGAHVVVCARKAPARSVECGGCQAVYEPLNVRANEEIDRLIQSVLARFGRLDVWVNNAGGAPPAAAATASPRFTSSIIELNLTAALVCAQKANAVMQAQAEGGCILQIGSVSALRPSPGTAAYGAAKAGLLSATQSLAMEWAPKVRVNAVSPGMVKTELSEQHFSEAAAATVPLARLASPADVGDACVYLASARASYISGVNLVVHGGGERPAFLASSSQS
ncbi:MAG TPA: SDR family oxidoreductase [Polyangiales bacterium]|nr:SDR family oxidoreductase [Polyangiales bacterium]